MSKISVWLPIALMRFSWFLAVFLFGYAVCSWGFWPNSVVASGFEAAQDLSINVRSYLGLFPTRHIYPASFQGAGVTVYKPLRMQSGVTFVTGFFDKKHVMKLLAPDGTELHRWEVAFGRIFKSTDHILPPTERPLNKWMTLILGAHLFRDGSVVLNFDGHGLVRIDACGRLIWKINRMTHHSVSLADDGTLWVPVHVYQEHADARFPLNAPPFFEDQLLQISQDGKVLRVISLLEIIYHNDLYSAAFAGFQEVSNQYPDFMHTNDAEILSKDLAPAFPMFKAGDIAVSMRQPNLIFVFDPNTGKVKWHQVVPFLRQHDPDFLKDGTISVFNNRFDGTIFGSRFGGSRITRVDPATHETWTAYSQPDGNGKRRFYTPVMGKHQTLDNGNILITESVGGRIFEVTPSGEIVWQFINRFDKGQVALVTGATRYPDDYVEFSGNTCKASGEMS